MFTTSIKVGHDLLQIRHYYTHILQPTEEKKFLQIKGELYAKKSSLLPSTRIFLPTLAIFSSWDPLIVFVGDHVNLTL